MSKQQQKDQPKHKEEGEPEVSERVPFFLRALSGIPDDVTFDELDDPESSSGSSTGSNTPTDSSSKPERTLFPWDTTHLDRRTYFIEQIYHAMPPIHSREHFDKNPDPSSHKKRHDEKSGEKEMDEDAEGHCYHLYTPRLLPELTDIQVNALSKKLLSNIAIYTEMRSTLKGKLELNELQQWEYDDFKKMAMSLAKPLKLDDEQKKAWQRHVVTNTLMWMIAIDYRYKFDLAQVYVDMVEVDQLSLVWTAGLHINHFALYPRVDKLWSAIDKQFA